MMSHGFRLLILLATVWLSACGGVDPQPAVSRSADEPVISGVPAGFNDGDVAFARDTIASYEQSHELNALVPARSVNPNVIALAADIDASQGPDLQMVKVLRVQWNSNSDEPPSPDGPADDVPGMVSEPTVAELKAAKGRDFDALWLRTMIGHQQGAAALAQREVAKGMNVDAVAMARRLVGGYQAQLARMEQLARN